MSTKNHSLTSWPQRLVNSERHREEIEWTLNAIAGAIVTGKLTPDDGFAWARIAVREASMANFAAVGSSLDASAA
jgi:hypothetical protein